MQEQLIVSVDDLVRLYSGLVRGVAWRVTHHLPPSVEFDDLVQEGMMRLIQLRITASFSENERGAFIATRVRGAMFDSLRSLDPISRRTRKMARTIFTRERTLMHALGRAPTHGEIAADAGFDIEDYFAVLRDISVGEHQSPDDEGRDEDSNPLDLLLDQEVSRSTSDAVEALSDRDREILTARYSLGERMRVTASKHGITESRICQIQKRAVDRLRENLAARGMLETA
jgi:RNA polymerase sigma factor for flagellar operon FliA